MKLDQEATTREVEQKLIDRLLRRDGQAARAFYDQYAPRLLGFIRRKVASEQDAEEIAQDTLFAFLEGVRDFTGKCLLNTYLCSIAHHKIVDFYRKKRLKRIVFSQISGGLEFLKAEGVDPEELLTRHQVEEKIAEVFASLTPRYAKILMLKYVEGRGVDEIARLMSCTFKSAESLLFRARRAFVRLYLSE